MIRNIGIEMSGVLSVLSPFIQTILGAAISLCSTLFALKIQSSIDMKRLNIENLRQSKKAFVNEMRNYYKLFIKYKSCIEGLYTSFSAVIAGQIRYFDWMPNTQRLNEIDLNEIQLEQDLHFNTKEVHELREIYGKFVIIMIVPPNKMEHFQSSIDKSEFLQLCAQFSVLADKHGQQIINKIKQECVLQE